MTAAHNDRCDTLLGRGCDCRSPWAPDTAPTGDQDRITTTAACAVCGGAPESTRHIGIDPKGHRYQPTTAAPLACECCETPLPPGTPARMDRESGVIICVPCFRDLEAVDARH